MKLKLFAFLFCGFWSLPAVGQVDHQKLQGDLMIGVNFRVLGNRGLGFHQFSKSSPEVQTLFFLLDHLAIGLNLRASFSDHTFLRSSLFDVSIQGRHWIGRKRRLSFIDLRVGRGLISNRWKDPTVETKKHHNTMFAFGMGRAQPLARSKRLHLEAEVFYEFRKSRRGSWFDSFKLDIGVKYLLGAARREMGT